jgi:hypothetical protein
MRHRLGEARFRIVVAAAVAALAALIAACWWLIPLLWEAPAVLRVGGMTVIAVLFALVIFLLWMLHWDHGRD